MSKWCSIVKRISFYLHAQHSLKVSTIQLYEFIQLILVRYSIIMTIEMKSYIMSQRMYSMEHFGIVRVEQIVKRTMNLEEISRYYSMIMLYFCHFKEKYNYCSDSLGYWRFDRLEDVLNDDSIKHLQVLTHDANWTDEVLSPRKRVRKFVSDKAESMYNEQVYGLIKEGMLCPDDED